MKKKILMVGMPASGKTSFVAALYRQLKDGNDKGLLKLDRSREVVGEKILKEAADQQIVHKKLPRTNEKIERIKMPLLDKAGDIVDFSMPDLLGENYKKAVVERRMDSEIVDKIRAADKILFFINRQTVIDEPRNIPNENAKETDSRTDHSKEVREVKKENEESKTDDSDKKIDKKDPIYNVFHTELLQILLEVAEKEQVLNISFILSAWDKVEDENEAIPSPKEFLRKEFPLLYQTIVHNLDRIKYQIWGVSAQGFDYADEQRKKMLDEQDIEPLKLIKAVDSDKNDIYDLSILLGDE